MKNKTPIYLTTEIRKIEQLASALPNPANLMEKAGLAAAKVAQDKLLTNERNKVLVLAGPGNNGAMPSLLLVVCKNCGSKSR